jgi:Zn-dependent M32 family carboxypeptidase
MGVEFASETAIGQSVWEKDREKSDFSLFQPKLVKMSTAPAVWRFIANYSM